MSVDDYENICKLGQFFYPASEHYRVMGRTGNIIVNCDRCRKTRLTSCIGYAEMDLCLLCADVVANSKQSMPIPTKPIMYKPDPTSSHTTFEPLPTHGQLKEKREKQLSELFCDLKHDITHQDQFEDVTLMVQSQFAPRTRMMQSQYHTKMVQSQFNKR
jgi:hypothetical protein